MASNIIYCTHNPCAEIHINLPHPIQCRVNLMLYAVNWAALSRNLESQKQTQQKLQTKLSCKILLAIKIH